MKKTILLLLPLFLLFLFGCQKVILIDEETIINNTINTTINNTINVTGNLTNVFILNESNTATGNNTFTGFNTFNDLTLFENNINISKKVFIDSTTNANNDWESLTITATPTRGGGIFVEGSSGKMITVSGYDSGSSRDLYFGGGAWTSQDSNNVYFYTDPAYAGGVDEGVLRMSIDNTGEVNILQNLDVDGTLNVDGLVTVNTLNINSGIYTDASKQLTSSIPTTGELGYWNRSGTILTPTTSTDSIQLNGQLNVGVDDIGYDTKFYGATASRYMLWDESSNLLDVNGQFKVYDGTTPILVPGTVGFDGTSIGYGATATYLGVSIGGEAGKNFNAVFNTFIGYQAGGATGAGTCAGTGNLALGGQSLGKFCTGSDNVALGNVVLRDFVTGTNNVVIGANSARSLITGGGNLIIGANVDVPTSTTDGFLSIGGLLEGNLIGGQWRFGLPLDNVPFFLGFENDYAYIFDGNYGQFDLNGTGTVFNGEVTINANLNVTDQSYFNDKVQITNQLSSDIPLEITGVTGQTANLFQINTHNISDVFHVFSTGHMTNVDGINTISAKYGTGFFVHNEGEGDPIYTDGFGYYDHTGGAREKLFTKTAGNFNFTQADADSGRFIVYFGQDTGATAEIKEYINETSVVVDGFGWDIDFSNQLFFLFEHPVEVIGDNNYWEVSVNGDGKAEFYSYNFTGEQVLETKLDAGADGVIGHKIVQNGNGYDRVAGQRIDFSTGNITVGYNVAGLVILTDETEATTTDESSVVAGIGLLTTNANNATKKAIVALPGWDIAFQVQGADATNPDYGYEITSGTVYDRVNSGGVGGNDAFINTSLNVELFDNNGDSIIISNDNPFEIMEVVLSIVSSKDIGETIEYSIGNGTWNMLPLEGDGLNGWKQSGLYTYNAPTDWAKGNEAIAPGDISYAYHVRINRTTIGVIPTLPTESYFKIFLSSATGMDIRGDGTIKPVHITDSQAKNDSLYYSTDQNKLTYKDSTGGINVLY